jgi:hypothetical protein
MAQLKDTGITGSLEVINAYITGSITGSDAKFTSLTGSLQGNASTSTTATTATTANTAIESNFIKLPSSIDLNEKLYDEGSIVDNTNWATAGDIIRIADTGDYAGQKFLVLREPIVGLRSTRLFSGDSTVSLFAMRNAGSSFYDSTGLNLSQSVTGEDLKLQYSTNGTSWSDYTNIMTGVAGAGLEVTSSAVTVTGISSPYYLRFVQTFNTEVPSSAFTTHYTESWESGFGDWTNGGAATSGGENESDDITQLIPFTRNSGGTTSSGTGPNSAHDGTFYIYTETSSPSSDNDWFGIQRSFTAEQSKDFSFLSFYYHAHGTTIGTLRVKVSTNDGLSWTTLNITKDVEGTPSTSDSISGQQQAVQTDPYQRALVDLSEYYGKDYLIRFIYQGGNGFTGDFAIDKVEFLQPSAAQYAIKDVLITPQTMVLEVDGAISASNYIGLPSAAASGVAGAIQFSDGTSLSSDGTNLFWDDANNTLGIGNATPEQRLHVNGTILSTAGSTGNNDNIEIRKTGAVSTSNVSYKFSHRSGGNELWLYSFDGSTFKNYVEFNHSLNYVGFPAGNAGDSDTLFVDLANSRVGVGNTTPGELLDVRTDTATAGQGARIGEAKIGTWESNTDWAAFTHNSIHSTVNSYAIMQNNLGRTIVNSATSQPVEFRINNSTKMYLQSDGNFGINTSVPSEILDVNGIGKMVNIERDTFDDAWVSGLTRTYDADSYGIVRLYGAFTSTITININNLIRGRSMWIYVRNTAGASRTVNVNASTGTSGHSAVAFSNNGGISRNGVTLALAGGTAMFWVSNANVIGFHGGIF